MNYISYFAQTAISSSRSSRRITLMPAINIQQVPNESVWYYYQETTKRRSRTPQNEKSRPAFCIHTTKDWNATWIYWIIINFGCANPRLTRDRKRGEVIKYRTRGNVEARGNILTTTTGESPFIYMSGNRNFSVFAGVDYHQSSSSWMKYKIKGMLRCYRIQYTRAHLFACCVYFNCIHTVLVDVSVLDKRNVTANRHPSIHPLL